MRWCSGTRAVLRGAGGPPSRCSVTPLPARVQCTGALSPRCPTGFSAPAAPPRRPARCASAEAFSARCCASAEASTRCADEASTRCADGASTSARFCSYYDGKRPATLVLSPGIAREETSCAGALARYGAFRAAPAGKALGALDEVPPYAPHGARCAPDNLRAAQARAGSWLLPSQLLAVLNAIALGTSRAPRHAAPC